MTKSIKIQLKEVAEMTRSAPFFSRVPCVRFRHAQITVEESLFKRAFLSLAFIMLGLVALLSVLQAPERHSIWTLPVMILGGILLCGGILQALSTRKICMDRTDCHLCYGSVLNRKVLSIPRDRLLINIDTAADRGYWSDLPYGSILLTLALRDSNESMPAIPLAIHTESRPIQRVFDVLAEFMQESADNSLAEIISNNGSIVTIPRTGLSRCAQEFKSASFSVTSNGHRLIVTRSFTLIALWVITFLFGLSGVVFLIITGLINSSFMAGIIFISGFAGIACLGAIGIFPGFGSIRTVVDREQKVVLTRQGFGGNYRGKRTFHFEQIIGVHIRPKHDIGDPEAGTFTVFDINFVLQRDAGIERFHIMSGRDEGMIVSYAKRVAGFIEKPIYDHR